LRREKEEDSLKYFYLFFKVNSLPILSILKG